jgi:hypothetical protein
VIGLAVFVIIAVTCLSHWEYINSRDVPAPSAAELRQHLTRATDWVFANSTQVATENNAMLWLFLWQAAKLGNNARLLDMANEYREHYAKGTVSQFFFDSSGSEQIARQPIHLSSQWADYQRLFVYGATCNESVRADPNVQALLTPSGCDAHLMWLRSPWCHTHQLMGLRFVQENHCEPGVETDQTIKAVQGSILAELRNDFRVEDAYLQKVLTLVESGRRQDIKPVWIRRILDAQRPDGGWDGVDILAQLPGGKVLAWDGGRLYPWIRPQPRSNLHATAQGIYLLALLLNDGT